MKRGRMTSFFFLTIIFLSTVAPLFFLDIAFDDATV